jgi:sigma-B regulation protein RsbU (phosphoserine phosphatase)
MIGDACGCPAAPSVWTGDDLAAAARLQHALLPPSPYASGHWTAAHRFAPAGAVGGDIVDLVPAGDRLYFLVADVSGKGIAASLLTAYVHAVFRSLIPFDLPLAETVRRASALLCASTLPAQYVTLVFGSLGRDGDVHVANAGHPPPLVIAASGQTEVVPTGAAAGLFCDSQFGTARLQLEPGDTMLIYSDGLTEAFDGGDQEYGVNRIRTIAQAAAHAGPAELIDRVSADHAAFLQNAPPADDLTILALRRERPADVLVSR